MLTVSLMGIRYSVGSHSHAGERDGHLAQRRLVRAKRRALGRFLALGLADMGATE